VEGPTDGGRRLPDGAEIRWRVARIRQDGWLLPFLIEDVTPRSLRVPGGPVAEHPNGATGISRLELAASNERAATRSLAALVGARTYALDPSGWVPARSPCRWGGSLGRDAGSTPWGPAPLRPGSRLEKGARRGGWTDGSPKGPAYGY
jgi:hypothetical protein